MSARSACLLPENPPLEMFISRHCFVPERMAESIKEEMDIKENDIKQEIFSPQDDILPSSTVEDTCTVYVKEDILPSSTVEDTCTVYVKEDILSSSTVEDTCTVYVKEEDVKIEITELKGKM